MIIITMNILWMRKKKLNFIKMIIIIMNILWMRMIVNTCDILASPGLAIVTSDSYIGS
jgi:hypothetical protein